MKRISKWILSIVVGTLCLLNVEHGYGTGGGGKDAKAWWPQFLGPQRNGIAADKNLNTDWKKTPPRVVWKVPLGDGFSSFAIVGDRAYTMCQRQNRCLVVCLDTANGKELWVHDVCPGYVDKQKQGPGPRATPTFEDGKLYCLMPMGELVCLAAADGKRLWTADQFKDTGAANPAGAKLYWGVAVSPLVEGDLLIVQPGGKKNNSVAAFDKNTGKLAWTVGDDPVGYGSPIAISVAGRRQLIVPTGHSVLGLEPAKGKLLWRYDFGNQYNCSCTTPVWSDGLLWVSAAYGTGSAALEISRKGEAWTVKEKWKNKNGLQTLYANGMVVDGHIYGCSGDLTRFIFKCVDFKTGAVKWEQELDNRHWLLALDGHLLSWSESGTLQLVETQPREYVLKGEMAGLLVPKSWAAPAFADGRLYLRDQRQAMCIDLRRP